MEYNWPGTPLNLEENLDKTLDSIAEDKEDTEESPEDSDEAQNIAAEEGEEEAKESPSKGQREEYNGIEPLTWTVHDPKTGKETHYRKEL
jgi:hypothetical protein